MADQKVTALTVTKISKITDLLYLVTFDDDGDSISVAMSVEDLLKSVVTGVNRIISGQVIWTGTGFTHRSIQLSYEINGVIYYSDAEDITNSAPDGSNPRFDVIFVDSSGLDIKEGTPAGSPTVPSLDNPTSELATNIVLVTNGETTPTGVTLEALYSENLQESGGEWDTAESTSDVRIHLANTDSPINLTKDIKATSPNGGDTFDLQNTTPIDIADFQNIRQKFLSLISSGWKGDYLRIGFYDGATDVGYVYINANSFDTSDTSTVFDIYKTKDDINWVPGETQFDKVEYLWIDGGGGTPVSSVRFQIDLIKIEHGGITTSSKLNMDAMPNMTNAKTTPIDADNLTLWDSIAEQFKQFPWDNFKNNLQKIYNVKNYGAMGDGVDYTDGAITASDATFTSASNPFVAGDVGKVIAISGAGTSAGYHITTIASYTSTGEVELTDNAVTTVSGKIFYFGTDDTEDIQDTINACFNAGGGIVFIPNGIYVLNGALQNDIGAELIDYNSQLYIPYSVLQVTTRKSMKILGETPPMLYQSNGIGNAKPTHTGVILRSSIIGTGTKPSVIASRGDSGDGFFGYNYTGIVIENLQIQLTPITTSNTISMGGMNFSTQGSTFVVKMFTAFPYNIWLGDTLEPSVTISGLELPFINCEHICSAEYVELGGFTNGFVSGEHSYFSNCYAIACTNAYVQTANNEPAYFNAVSSYWCDIDFKVTGESQFKISLLDIEWENDSKWYDNVTTISDASNLGDGEITLNIVEADVGVNNAKYAKIGGNEIRVKLVTLGGNINTQTGTSYTFVIEDAQAVTEGTNAGATDFTVPPDSTLNYDLGATINVIQSGAGQITIVAGGGVTIRTPETLLLRKQYSMCAIVKIAADEWSLTGDLELA